MNAIMHKMKEMFWGNISFLGIYDRFEGNQYYRICLSTCINIYDKYVLKMNFLKLFRLI